jgi:hypothetical protein
MELNWEPQRLVTALAVAPALAELPAATSIESALSLAVDCPQVGQLLWAAAESPDAMTFASCDQSCTVSLCESAVAAAWARARYDAGTGTEFLSLTASGTAQLGDDARATALRGSWVGTFHPGSGDDAPVSGMLSASSSP